MGAGVLFFSTRGRIARKPYWLGHLLLLFIVFAGVAATLPWLIDYEGAPATPRWYWPYVYTLSAATVWPTYALTVKRLQDRGKGPALARLYVGAGVAHVLAGALRLFPEGGVGDRALDIAYACVLLLVAVAAGFKAGDPGQNRFGPPPSRKVFAP